MTIPCQRHRFDIPDDVHYLNCAYMSPLADQVSAAIAKGAAYKARPWTYTPDLFFSISEAFRERCARLVGAEARDMAIIPSASYGLAVAAQNLPLAKGQEVVTLEAQFPSNVYGWRTMAARVGAKIVTARRSGGSWTDAVLGAIAPATGIVAVPHCHWVDGGALDLIAIGEACRAVGAALVLDLTQSLGAMPFDLAAVQPDFMVAACYKWLLGPYGIGMMYVAPRWQDGRPIEENWMNRIGSENFARLTDYQDGYQPGARRYDMGEKSNPPLLMGASAALDLIDQWGAGNIADTLGARTATLAEAARLMGLTARDEPDRAAHFLSLGFPGGMPDDLPERLAASRVFVSARGTSLRVTPHLWTTDEDAQRLIGVLRTCSQPVASGT
ncbi:aminotransferase class V-fold PLP-dependent enzyme [Pacificimonas sp. WHA3]|uniref:Aminotransferase class V-fold PLP-dependent enzyme n=1 Tax=Pacificimonas pallii TaxID=2827236 RepID=A0ABS6SCH9_9SPHN|nr:aminotransferase class V-fold PLP-dependent enzyme [Pacificimonas pallii]MBV7256026.1 aminotransferase class V-fold PLP-dependent enzyme [Pacificimonas pallii]